MVQAGQNQKIEINGYRVLNNRYLRIEECESASFATVYKALDVYTTEDGTVDEVAGAPRLLSEEHAAMVQTIAKESPEIEFVGGDPSEFSEEKK